MDRLLLLVIVCATLVGCQASTTGFDPFAFGRQTRVPPPPTNVIGNTGTFQRRPSPLPPVDAGAATWPHSNLAPGSRYGEAALDRGRATEAPRQLQADSLRASGRAENVELARNDRLTWRDPDSKQIIGSVPTYREEPLAADFHAPRLLPGTGPVEALASKGDTPRPVSHPVRVRGFNSAGSREVRIPAALAEFQRHHGLRQAANWQPRYNDIRR